MCLLRWESLSTSLRISNDLSTCYITAICVLPDGKVVVGDSDSKKVKLLNPLYQVVSQCDVSACVWDICQITRSEVAVTVNENEVMFIQSTKATLS
ncbi:hypothetical protein DPMN_183433 [Dreissena polymorpha]|uniref:Uncharacterized protein n=1 Tax=Dreissena polymorpha TaxID=45954 RepID=A0A9D4I5I3_DREPO|nr:hypothetical protein DPMN_183433 [Dreissena polymorpha]